MPILGILAISKKFSPNIMIINVLAFVNFRILVDIFLLFGMIILFSDKKCRCCSNNFCYLHSLIAEYLNSQMDFLLSLIMKTTIIAIKLPKDINKPK